MTIGEGSHERASFTEGRVDNVAILQELVSATGLSEEVLREKIPETSRQDLAFGGRWANDSYDNSEVGQFNANAVKDFVLLYIPVLNVAGTEECNLDGINLSYAINVSTGEITGAEDFYGAETYLHDNFATARKKPEDLPFRLGRQALFSPDSDAS